MYLIKIYRKGSGNVLIISADNFVLLGWAVNVYRKDMEDTSFILHENDHVYIMNTDGDTVDQVLIKAKPDKE